MTWQKTPSQFPLLIREEEKAVFNDNMKKGGMKATEKLISMVIAKSDGNDGSQKGRRKKCEAKLFAWAKELLEIRRLTAESMTTILENNHR